MYRERRSSSGERERAGHSCDSGWFCLFFVVNGVYIVFLLGVGKGGVSFRARRFMGDFVRGRVRVIHTIEKSCRGRARS